MRVISTTSADAIPSARTVNKPPSNAEILRTASHFLRNAELGGATVVRIEDMRQVLAGLPVEKRATR